jgi:hypothetical protein
LRSGSFRPAPPSNQGKWFARQQADALRWMLLLYPAGQAAHVLEVEVPDGVIAGWFSLATLDGIGPAVFADLCDLPGLNASMVRIAEV